MVLEGIEVIREWEVVGGGWMGLLEGREEMVGVFLLVIVEGMCGC